MARASTAFGTRLRQQRQVTVKGLARQLGVDSSFVSRIERGVVDVPDQLVRDLSQALGTVEEPLLVLAGHLPDDVDAILLEHPERSLALLREQLGPKRTGSRPAPSSRSAAAPEAQGRGAGW